MPPRKATTPAAKVRRAHRKSRNGCLECKRRHIKCDEARPTCSNCAVSERACEFPSGAAPPPPPPPPPPTPAPSQPAAAAAAAAAASSRQQQSSARTTRSLPLPWTRGGSEVQSPAGSSSAASSHVFKTPPFRDPLTGFPVYVDDEPASLMLPALTDLWVPSPASAQQQQDPGRPQPTFTARHLALLHYAETADSNITLGTDMMRPMLDIAVTWAADAPYVMDQILALCADHLALTSPPADATTHRRTATELQTRALSWFNRDAQETTDEERLEATCVPRFLFAALLSVHVLYELFAHYRANIHVFVDRFAESVNLHRGVRAITRSTYHLIEESGLRRFLLEVREAQAERFRGTECAELTEFIEAADLGPSTVAGCRQAVQSLQWAFNLQAAMPAGNNARAGSAFPVLLTSEFVDALRKRRPEALVVLAHYGVLLHRCRGSWIFGDAGAFLIHLIADYLGSVWQDALRWPLEVLRTEQG